MFALAAAVVAFLAIIDALDTDKLLWWWLMFIALHLAVSWTLPIPNPPWGRNRGS